MWSTDTEPESAIYLCGEEPAPRDIISFGSLREKGDPERRPSLGLTRLPPATAHGFLTKKCFGLSIQCGSLGIIVITPGLPTGSGATNEEGAPQRNYIYEFIGMVVFLGVGQFQQLNRVLP